MAQLPLAETFKDSALPARRVRAIAFCTIILGGIFGGLIGYMTVSLQCHGNCSVADGLGTLVGSSLAAMGSAIIAVLVLRAMTEWQRQRR